jgi:hypothetical protein
VLVNRNKLIIGILALIIFIILEYSFVYIILGEYGEFRRFASPEVALANHFVGILLALSLTSFLVIFPCSDFIYAILNIILVISIYPALILYEHLGTDWRIVMLHVVYFLSIYIFSNLLKLNFGTSTVKESQKTTTLLMISVLLIVPFVVLFAPHIDISNLALSNIYESRAIEVELSTPYTGYVYSPLTNILLPTLLVFSLIQKEYLKASAAVIMLLFMFLVGGHKTVFFGTFLVLFFYFGHYYRKITFLFAGIVVAVLFAIIAHSISDFYFPTSLITRRIFFLPAILEVGYFDFFDGSPLYWSDSVLRSINEYPYELAPRNLVGQHVLLNPLTNANNGIISDGFMNFGIAGSLMNIFFVSALYAIFNSLRISARFFGLFFILFFTLYSTYFFTAMLTHGVILLVIMAALFLQNSRQKYDFSDPELSR